MDKYKVSSQWIDNSERIVIIPHHNADGDAIGSSLGLYNLLLNMGKMPIVVCPNDFPDSLKWMNGADNVLIAQKNMQKAKSIIDGADLILMTDFNGLGRIDNLKDIVAKASAKKIVIDHHPNPEDFADILFSDVTVSSASELVYRFINKTGCKKYVNKAVAECIFVGIMTDTGSFSFNSSNPETFITVSELLEYDINKDDIYNQVFDNYSEHRLRLLGYCMNEKLVVFPEYKAGFISITKEELVRFEFEIGDTEGFVNYPLSIKGIIFSAIFIEKDNHIKTSFRSKGNFSVNDFSRNHFNGGGHINAAGGRCNLNMEETLNRFVKLLPDYSDKLNNLNNE